MRKNIIIAVVALLTLVAGAVAFSMLGSEDSMGKLPSEMCTKEYMPVCGVNGITYGNACMAGGMEIAFEGECFVANPDAVCTMDYNPVCGIDGKTYSNRCVAEQGNGVPVAYAGECDSGAAGGTFPAGEVPGNLTDEELASS